MILYLVVNAAPVKGRRVGYASKISFTIFFAVIPQVDISSHSFYENPAFKSLTAFSKIGKTDADKNI
jgi:hypothetical protein